MKPKSPSSSKARRGPEHRQTTSRDAPTEVSKRSAEQDEWIERCLAESCIGDPTIPLGSSGAARPEYGPTVGEYFRAKAERGERGQFWPLHTLAISSTYNTKRVTAFY